MISRGTIIAALVVIELAITGEAVVAVRGVQPSASFMQRTYGPVALGPNLVEGGPHKLFEAGAHPALTIDIGYADLTIVTGDGSQIDVSVSPSPDHGWFQATAPFTAQADGETIRIATTSHHGWSLGDDRMVTVLVPRQTHVTVVNAGDIKANGLRAEASIHAAGQGSVTVEDYAAPALHVAASNGRIILRQIVAQRLEATSDDGRVEGSALQVRDGSIQSDGRVTLGFAPGADTLVTAKASNGRIRLSGLTATASDMDKHTSSADDDDDAATETVRVGAGDGHLDVHSSDGNITLTQ